MLRTIDTLGKHCGLLGSQEQEIYTITLMGGFESFYGRASEDNEFQWRLNYPNSGTTYYSKRFEKFEDFITRVSILEDVAQSKSSPVQRTTSASTPLCSVAGCDIQYPHEHKTTGGGLPN